MGNAVECDQVAAWTASAVLDESAQTRAALRFEISDRNQFYFYLPNGLLATGSQSALPLSTVPLSQEEERACLLLRVALSNGGAPWVDSVRGRRVTVGFDPVTLIVRDRDGGVTLRQAETAPAEDDIGGLLDNLQAVQTSLAAVEDLIRRPDALLTTDPTKRSEARAQVVASCDRTLIGLERLGDIMTRASELGPKAWREAVHAALTETVQSMVEFEGLSDAVRQEKQQEMRSFQASIENYLLTIDPNQDKAEIVTLTGCVNRLVLDDQKRRLDARGVRLDGELRTRSGVVLDRLRRAVGKGSSLAIVPRVMARQNGDAEPSLRFNMIHAMMAVRSGGFSIALDLTGAPALAKEVWSPGGISARVHLVPALAMRSLRPVS